jgi:HK97 family phage prohead protease
MEKRTYRAATIGIETREAGAPVSTGHAAVFNTIESSGWFREQVAPGAFTESLKEDDVRALWNHDTTIVLGRNKAGTLKLREDDKGLAVEITPPDTQQARDLMETINRGDVTQMSFGFQVKKATWTEEEDEEDLRTIEQVKLWEVSPVTFPFYKDTDVSLKSEHRAWRESLAPRPITYKTYINRRRLELKLSQTVPWRKL